MSAAPDTGEAPAPASAIDAPLVVSPEQARKDTEVEALVLAGDLCELARLLTARLKETVISLESVEGLATVAEGLTQIERAVVQAKFALDLGMSCARV